jgi:hypothetical protein
LGCHEWQISGAAKRMLMLMLMLMLQEAEKATTLGGSDAMGRRRL